MAKTIIWNRTEQNCVHSGGQVLVFASGADADVWLGRKAISNADNKTTKPLTGVTSVTFDKITVT